MYCRPILLLTMFRSSQFVLAKLLAANTAKPIPKTGVNACLAIRLNSSAQFTGEWLKAETRPEHVVETQEMKDRIKNDKIFLIDVREPDEVAMGRVPAKKYVNIPIGVLFQSLALSDNEFKKQYGVDKPDPSDTEIVFMCLAGIRSTWAFQIAKQMGYMGSKHYLDGWMGWEESNSD